MNDHSQADIFTRNKGGKEAGLQTPGAIFCDLDGCLVTGNRLLPGVDRLYRAVGERMWILSNNSTETPDSVAARIGRLGLNIPPERIVLAGTEAVLALIAIRPQPRVALFASPALKGWAADQALELTDTAPDAVLLCRDLAFNYDSLARIIRFLEAGAELFVANPDTSHPAADGGDVPETGALLAAVLAVRPSQAYRTIGKPAAQLFMVALQRSGFTPEQVMMIGDNIKTDGSGANALDIPFTHVSPSEGVLAMLGSQPC